MTAPEVTVTEEGGCYVVTFPNGGTSAWETNRSFLFDPGHVEQLRRNADALEAIIEYRAANDER